MPAPRRSPRSSTTLACLAIAAGRARGTIGAAREAALVEALLELPSRAVEALALDLAEVAELVAQARDVLFLAAAPASRSPWKAR